MKNLLKALAEFQQEVPVIHKDSKAYGYSYADLPTIFETINPLLKEHGLGFTQLLIGDNIKTIVFHVETGEQLESETCMNFESLVYETVTKTKNGSTFTTDVIRGFEGMNTAQAKGSLITYFRRYSLSAMLGLVTDVDNDANAIKSTPPKMKEPVKKQLPELVKDSDKWIAVVNAIKGGYKLDQVKTKYKVSKELETELLTIINE